MKVLFVMDSVLAFQSGIWLHRTQLPSLALQKRGHAIKQVSIGKEFPEEMLQWPDIVVFGRAYNMVYDPAAIMHEFKKRGKRVIYDLDDDYWNVPKDNPSFKSGIAFKTQYEAMIKAADAIITPSPILAKKFKKHFKKKVFICPNGVDLDSGKRHQYSERPHNPDGLLKIGYMGAASHWKDLQLIGEVVVELAKKHDFLFVIYGMVGEPLEATIYNADKILQLQLQPEKTEYYNELLSFYKQLQNIRLFHVPFMPPELHPKTLSNCDLDIGLAPLMKSEFNSGKSNVKFYEYAATGAVCLASDVEPYKQEVPYRAKNTFDDWYKKLEKLIVDEKFRKEELERQQKWVKENRSLDQIGIDWEMALDVPGGLALGSHKTHKKKK